jgi:superfamily II DNA or RNA helicase
LSAGAGADPRIWLDSIRSFTDPSTDLGGRIVLATYQTARTERFLSRIHPGGHLLVVADEVHYAGASDSRRILDVDAGGRLGLSATPDRFGDPEGTAAIHAYFGEVLTPRFTIADAITAGRLVPYIYSFELVSLTQEEQDTWDDLTKKISIAVARSAQGDDVGDYLANLLRRRARVLRRAEGKLAAVHAVLAERFSPHDRWLIYCESLNHLALVREAISDLRLPILEYHSAMDGDRKETLRYLAERGGVLLAVKCLDEGVDIPVVNKAMILASTTNPREYIQRRGRILRTASTKFHAVLIDTLVTDVNGIPLSLSELTRAEEFASSADNFSAHVELQALILATEKSAPWSRVTKHEDHESGESNDE